MAGISEGPERPSLKLYARMVEIYADQDKIDHAEAAAWLGVERTLMEWAFKKGWPGHKKTGRGALAPIKDQIARMRYSAAALTEQLERVVTREGEKELVDAIRDGTVKRAVEGLVSRGFLKIIQEQVDTALAMQMAAKPLADRLISNLQTLVTAKKLTMAEIKSELGFVQLYAQSSLNMAERYQAMEKTREANRPAQLEDKEKVEMAKKSEGDIFNEFLSLVNGIKDAFSNQEATQLLKAPKVIDVTPD